MIYWQVLSLIFFNIFLSSCQVQSPDIQSAGQLSTATATNYPAIFVVTTSESGLKKIGDQIEANLFFPYPITVSGSPYLMAQVGSQTKTLSLVSGAGTQNLKFRYTVASGDEDEDGIEFYPNIFLNGGSLRYPLYGQGILIDTPTEISFSDYNITIDGIRPTVSEFIDYISDPTYGPTGALHFKNYKTDDELLFRFKFSEPVDISPLVNFNLFFNSTVSAIYSSGTGSDTAYFKRKILSSDSDPSGFFTAGAFNLNPTITIKDRAGNSLINTFNPLYFNVTSNYVYINVPRPTITSISVTNNTYTLGQNIDFTVNYSEIVKVTGVPSFTINLQSAPVSASYISGSGSTALVFRHQVLQDERAPVGVGVTLDSEINTSSGSIKNNAGNQYADPIIPIAQRTKPGVVIDSVQGPYVTYVEIPSNKTYVSGETFQFKLTFNKIVNINTGGNPRLKLFAGSTPFYAPIAAASGSGTNTLTFEASVPTGLLASSGISMDPYIDLNTSTIKDADLKNASLWFLPPNTSGIKIDSLVLATSGSLVVPSSGTYIPGQILNFSLPFNRPISISGASPQIGLTIGSTAVDAICDSVSGSNLICSYELLSGQEDTNGITISTSLTNHTSVKDANGIALTSATITVPTSAINVDGLAPNIETVTSAGAGNYVAGNILTYTILFNQPVFVSGSPRLKLNINGNYGYAIYHSGNGTNTLNFKYTVGNNLITSGTSVAIMSPLELNSGSIRDSSNNYMGASQLTFSPSPTSDVFIDSIPPYINTVISSTQTLPYKSGDTISFTVNFSEAVVITGSPKINLMIGNTPKTATYSGSGTSSTTHSFSFTVGGADLDLDGITSYLPFDLTGATIKDGFGNSVVSTYQVSPHPGTKVDGIIPLIQFVYFPEDKTYGKAENLLFKVSWSESVTIVGTPKISIVVGSTSLAADYVSSTGNVSTFRYIVQNGHQDTDGINANSPITLGTGVTITDSAGNNANLAFTSNHLTGVLVDGITPTITSVTLPVKTGANAPYYNLNEKLTFNVAFTDTMVVDTTGGTPRLKFKLGGNDKYAYYDDTVDNLTDSYIPFSYTVASGDETGTTPISLTSLESNLGTIKDDAFNTASLSLPTIPIMSRALWLVDAKTPTLVSVTSEKEGYYPGQNIDFKFTFSEAMNVVGTPTISIKIDQTWKTVNFHSISGSVVTFRYTVPAGNVELDLNGIDHQSSITLPAGASITDIGSGTAPALTYSFSETDFIYFNGLNARYRLNSGEFTANAFNEITYLRDLSGSGKHISKSSGGAKLYAGSFGGYNRNAMEFTTMNYFTLPTLNSITQYVVVGTGAYSSSTILTNLSSGTATRELQFNGSNVLFSTNTKLMRNGVNLSSGSYLTSHPFSFGGMYVLAATPQTSFTKTWNLGLTPPLSSGPNVPYAGTIAEVLIFTYSTLTDTQLTKISSQLMEWYDLY